MTPKRLPLALFITLFILATALLTQAQAATSLQVNGTISSEGAEALQLDIFFTLTDSNGRPQPAVAPQTVTLLLEDGNQYTADLQKPPYYIAIALDASGSMAGVSNEMIQSARNLINQAPPEVEFAVVQFGDTIDLLQPFTADRTLALNALNSFQLGEVGSCLSNVSAATAQSLDQIAQGTPRRAMVLFTDGLEPVRDDVTDCPAYTPDAIVSLANGRSVSVPIYTVGLSERVQDLNLEAITSLSSVSGGDTVIGASAAGTTLYPKIIDLVNSQWQAQAEIYPPAGYHRGMLNITLSDGSPLPSAPISFNSNRNYETPPEPATIAIDSFKYDEVANSYLFEVLLTQYEGIAGFRMAVLDAESNVQETQLIQRGEAWLSQQLQFSGTDLKVDRPYILSVTLLNNNLLPVLDANGEILRATYEFRHEPIRPLQLIINSVRVNDNPGTINWRDLTVDDDPPEIQLALVVRNGDQATSYEGHFLNPATNQQIGDKFSLTTLIGDSTGTYALNFFLPVTENGRYTVIVNGITADGTILASDSYSFTYTATNGPFVRAWYALQENGLLIALGVLLLIVISLLAWGLGASAGKRRAAQILKKETAVVELKPVVKKSSFPAVALKIIESPDDSLTQNGHLLISKSPYTIGREGCDLSIAKDQHVSRRHAQITFESDTFFIEDFNSSNGTFVNGAKIPSLEPTPLSTDIGAKIQIGKRTVLSFHQPEKPEQ